MLDLLMVAQGEHKRLGITLTVPQQEQPEEEGGKRSLFKTVGEEKPPLPSSAGTLPAVLTRPLGLAG